MAETLGSLCDKLSIVKLKQWHTEDPARTESLGGQELQLKEEIDLFLRSALYGHIPPQNLTFAANKVYAQAGNEVGEAAGSIGQLIAQLAHVNCALWHEQEKVYEFERVPVPDKDKVVKRLALLNLERNQCIDGIDRGFRGLVEDRNSGRPGAAG